MRLGSFAFVPYYASVQYGMSPFESGAILTPRSVTAILLGTMTSLLMFGSATARRSSSDLP